MNILIAAVSFFAVIIVLVLGHEIGHFTTAKLTGVKVEEFGLFYPPRLLSFKKGDTVYSLNAIPLGGFVKMAGEEDPDVPGSLSSKKIWVRLLVLSAGSLMNFILPLVLFTVAYMVPHDAVRGTVVVADLPETSAAVEAGLEEGDIIIAVDDREVENSGDVYRYFQLNLGKQIDLHVIHQDNSEDIVPVTPSWRSSGAEETGVAISTLDPEYYTESLSVFRAIPVGVTSCIDTFVLFKNSIVSIVIGETQMEFAGPVGIAQMAGEIAESGVSPLLEFAAFLSINFAIVNLFPLPALDGGRIAFVLVEWIRRGKRLSPFAEGKVHLIGFALLMIFFLAVTFQDILRITRGESLLS